MAWSDLLDVAWSDILGVAWSDILDVAWSDILGVAWRDILDVAWSDTLGVAWSDILDVAWSDILGVAWRDILDVAWSDILGVAWSDILGFVCFLSREEAMQLAVKMAASVPMNVAVISNQLWPTLTELAKIANISCKSDLQVCMECHDVGGWSPSKGNFPDFSLFFAEC